MGHVDCGRFLVLALVALFIRPRPQPVVVRLLGESDGDYVVEVSNATHRVYSFTAASEYETYGLWRRWALPHTYLPSSLMPHAAHVFSVQKPDKGKPRIAVVYNRISEGTWEHWRDSLRAMAGFSPKPERMYIDAP
jgi:hypothetical protein